MFRHYQFIHQQHPVTYKKANLNAPKNNLSLGFELSEAAYIVSFVGLRIVNLFSDDDPLSIATDKRFFNKKPLLSSSFNKYTFMQLKRLLDMN